MKVPHSLSKLFGGSCSPCPWVTQIPFSLGSKGRQVYEGGDLGSACPHPHHLQSHHPAGFDQEGHNIPASQIREGSASPPSPTLFLPHLHEIFGAKGHRCLWASVGGRCGVGLWGMRPQTTLRWELGIRPRPRIWKSQLYF